MSIKQTKKEIAKLVVNCSIKYLSVIKFFDLMKKQQKHYTDFTYAGNGAFAFVLKANNKLIGQTVALKVVECDSSDIVGMESVQQEYELLQGLSSKYIVKVFNCFFLTVDDDSDNDSNDEDEEQIVESKIKKQKSEIKVFFVVEQEFCQTNLETYFLECRQKKILPTKQEKEIMLIQMLDSIAYLHRFDIVHRDIKPSNFLLQFDLKRIPTVKICDLAFASALKYNQSRITVSKIKGTQAYLAPEIEKGIQKKESDVFSLGIVFLELDNIATFNCGNTTNEDKFEIKFGNIYTNYQIDRQSSIYKIAQQCLNYYVEKRKPAIELLVEFIHQNQQYLNINLYSMINKSQLKLKSEQLSQIQKSSIEYQQKKQSQVLELSQHNNNQKLFESLMKTFNQLKYQPFEADEYETILKILQSDPKYDSNLEFISVGAKGLILGTFNKINGRSVALKIQKFQSKHEVVLEVGIMRDCQMPLVIKFYDFFYLSVKSKDDFVVFELEKCSGNLKQFLNRLKKEQILLSEHQKMQIAVQIIDVINYLNYNGIVHRDIKLENILYINNEPDVPSIKLADFDQSRKLPYQISYDFSISEYYNEYSPAQGVCGTLGYIPPEFFDNQQYTLECEIFQVGVCLALLDNFEKLEPVILKKALDYLNGFSIPFEQGKNFLDEVINRQGQIYDILLQTVVFKPQQRKSLSQILLNLEKKGYPFYSKIYSSTQECLLHKKHSKILKLNYKYNNIGSDGAKAIASEIAKCTNLSTLSLYLYYNNIGSDGAKALASEIAKCTNLSTLSLYLQSNNIGSDGAKALASEIAKCTNLSTLTLDLMSNNIGSDGAKALASEIAKCTNLSTLTLDLMSNNIGSDGAKALASEIAKCTNLSTLTLNLFENNIGSDGAKALASEIAKCTNLSTLTLNLLYNNIGSDGAKALASEIAKCTNLLTQKLILD
ncbi:hypothetical protein ABPG73_006402 [Tetrahymena malaccensis]